MITHNESNPPAQNTDLPRNCRLLLLALREAMKHPTFRKEYAVLLGSYPDMFMIEPMYTRQVAMRLIPMTVGQIDVWSERLRIPHRYRVFGSGQQRKRYRMYSATEIKQLRSAVTRDEKYYAEKILTQDTRRRKAQSSPRETSSD